MKGRMAIIEGVKTPYTDITFYVHFERGTIDAITTKQNRLTSEPRFVRHDEQAYHDGTAKSIKAYCKRFIERRGCADDALTIEKKHWIWLA
jgi:hypothetical protein